MSAKTQAVIPEEDFPRWELHAMQVLADLYEKYMSCTAKVVPAPPKQGEAGV